MAYVEEFILLMLVENPVNSAPTLPLESHILLEIRPLSIVPTLYELVVIRVFAVRVAVAFIVKFPFTVVLPLSVYTLVELA